MRQGFYTRIAYPKCASHLLEIVMQLMCSSSEMFSRKHYKFSMMAQPGELDLLQGVVADSS
ncbi:hypothetical protein OIU77_005400 [Salix suchowensis]|uniref:Uncharacterized protein n=1 Tax=Salix suchowensis TaxID=1278906 RepID=A0ABQ9ARA1_9ROSI|nr:hypothetical protein OIU77_005400 [Salix suchowensis]